MPAYAILRYKIYFTIYNSTIKRSATAINFLFITHNFGNKLKIFILDAKKYPPVSFYAFIKG